MEPLTLVAKSHEPSDGASNRIGADCAVVLIISSGARPRSISDDSDHSAPSVIRPENMLRESHRQKGLGSGDVPPVCVLDPDGDIGDHVRRQYGATRSAHWACYHTRLWEWEREGARYGIVGYAVGGAFSVLVAEQLSPRAADCSSTFPRPVRSVDVGPPPYYILVDRALRDEGTSYHYLPPAAFAKAVPFPDKMPELSALLARR
jgi:hypothetical protein